MKLSIGGSAVALVTPFHENGEIDIPALKRLVHFHVREGTNAIVSCGTTGESTVLSDSEQRQILETIVEESQGKVHVYGGAGSSNTRHATLLAKQAESVGVHALLSVAPYYNKPSQEGYLRHYLEIANATSLPIIIYNVPGRTGGNVDPDTMLNLCDKAPHISAIKEASGNMMQIMELLKSIPDTVSILSGDDALTFPMIMLGAKGVISVAANQVPGYIRKMVDAALKGDVITARKIHTKLLNLFQHNFIESNPIPVKYTLAKMNIIKEVYRLPLVSPSIETKKRLDSILKELALI